MEQPPELSEMYICDFLARRINEGLEIRRSHEEIAKKTELLIQHLTEATSLMHNAVFNVHCLKIDNIQLQNALEAYEQTGRIVEPLTEQDAEIAEMNTEEKPEPPDGNNNEEEDFLDTEQQEGMEPPDHDG